MRGLLGQPENSDGPLDLYSLGIGFGANLEYLAVEYDRDGRLARAATRRM
ncbi:hypothetical protein ACE7GA_22385 [Roseomonas sp. CCTCC AB2023176]